MEDVSAMNWKCYDCNMTFSNPTQLQKHKSRFCVGGGLGDPDQLMLRKGFRSEVKKDYDDLNTEDEPAKYNHNADPKVKQLAENHGRSMEAIHIRNRDLERQKEEIRRRLEDLGRRPVNDDGQMNSLLLELKDQEARNRFLLEDLRRQLGNKTVAPGPEPKVTKQIAYPVYYGNSLVAEISAVRQSYLSNGGSDPDILQQLAQMQAEAQAIDDSLKNKPSQKKDSKSDYLLNLELENERFQRQLLLLQEQNAQAMNRRKNEREDELERELRRMQQDHLHKMHGLQREMEKMRTENLYFKYQDKPSKIIVQSTHSPPPPQPITQYVEVDRLAPYDYSPSQPYAHTWAKTQYRQEVHRDPYYDLLMS